MNDFSNRTYNEIEIGTSLTLSRCLSETEVEALALVSGEVDPFHLDSISPEGHPKRGYNKRREEQGTP